MENPNYWSQWSNALSPTPKSILNSKAVKFSHLWILANLISMKCELDLAVALVNHGLDFKNHTTTNWERLVFKVSTFWSFQLLATYWRVAARHIVWKIQKCLYKNDFLNTKQSKVFMLWWSKNGLWACLVYWFKIKYLD